MAEQAFVFMGEISNHAYQRGSQQISILYKTGKVVEVAKASDYFKRYDFLPPAVIETNKNLPKIIDDQHS